MSKNLIIFGAGASFGSGGCIFDKVPPLGNGLLKDLIEYDSGNWGSLPSELVNTFNKDFESGMQELFATHSSLATRLQRSMAHYFFQFVPTEENIYQRIAKKISEINWPGSIITLNYELLLQRSLKEIGVNFSYFDNTNEHSIKLCIPHGCCNIFCSSVQAVNRGYVFNGPGSINFSQPGAFFGWDNNGNQVMSHSIQTNGDIEIIDDSHTFSSRIKNDAFPPIMAYFDPQKLTTSGSNFINFQQDRFKHMVSEANKIAIIGIKIREHDKHIWDSIKNSPADIIYCGGKVAGKEFERWSLVNRKSNFDRILHEYFSEEFDEICDFVDLN